MDIEIAKSSETRGKRFLVPGLRESDVPRNLRECHPEGVFRWVKNTFSLV